MKILIAVDMQNDFISGSLGTKEAQSIVPKVKKRLNKAIDEKYKIIFTKDTHYDDYLNTAEGKKLPIKHCIKETYGWEIHPELRIDNALIIEKNTFGSLKLLDILKDLNKKEPIEEIELLGLCTDICVISNALLIKAAFIDTPIKVNRNLCAGVTPQSHENALSTMEMCQIDIID